MKLFSWVLMGIRLDSTGATIERPKVFAQANRWFDSGPTTLLDLAFQNVPRPDYSMIDDDMVSI